VRTDSRQSRVVGLVLGLLLTVFTPLPGGQAEAVTIEATGAAGINSSRFFSPGGFPFASGPWHYHTLPGSIAEVNSFELQSGGSFEDGRGVAEFALAGLGAIQAATLSL
jgi:hypothetical protein